MANFMSGLASGSISAAIKPQVCQEPNRAYQTLGTAFLMRSNVRRGVEGSVPQWIWYRVPVAEIVKYFNPLSGKRWGCNPITPTEVKRAASEGNLRSEPWDTAQTRFCGVTARDFHIQRIAYLLKHSAPLEQDHKHPILFDPDPGIGIQNGNHRIAAAQVRDDREIVVKLFLDESEPQDLALKSLPGAVKL